MRCGRMSFMAAEDGGRRRGTVQVSHSGKRVALRPLYCRRHVTTSPRESERLASQKVKKSTKCERYHCETQRLFFSKRKKSKRKRVAVGGRTTEVLPALQSIFLEKLHHSGSFEKFVAARQHSNFPVVIFQKKLS